LVRLMLTWAVTPKLKKYRAACGLLNSAPELFLG
jgi:hypothetical protein